MLKAQKGCVENRIICFKLKNPELTGFFNYFSATAFLTLASSSSISSGLSFISALTASRP